MAADKGGREALNSSRTQGTLIMVYKGWLIGDDKLSFPKIGDKI